MNGRHPVYWIFQVIVIEYLVQFLAGIFKLFFYYFELKVTYQSIDYRTTYYKRSKVDWVYINRGLEPNLAKKVAKQLMTKDALGTHARDELGISEISSARPLQAAIFSACSFTLGALLPLLIIFIVPRSYLILTISVMSVLFLALLGGVAAKVGGARIILGSLRVVVWGTLAMIVSAGIGSLLGIAV